MSGPTMRSKKREPLTAIQFIEGLKRMKVEDLRRKYQIPPDLDVDLLAGILEFMQENEAEQRRLLRKNHPRS